MCQTLYHNLIRRYNLMIGVEILDRLSIVIIKKSIYIIIASSITVGSTDYLLFLALGRLDPAVNASINQIIKLYFF